jgi:hypothetical protein
MKKEDSLSRTGKTSGLLMTAAFAGMMLPQQSDAQVASEPPDYGNSFASRTDLGSGIVLVNGSVDIPTDLSDFFQISGLIGGSSFSIAVNATRTSGAGAFMDLRIFNTSGASLANTFADLASSSTFSGTLTGTVPADGILVGSAQYNEGAGSASYSFAIPEPRVSILTAAGALAALAARRRKKKAESAE